MRSLPLRSERVRLDGVAGASFTGLLSAPESEERKRPCTVKSAGTEGDVRAWGTDPRLATEGGVSR